MEDFRRCVRWTIVWVSFAVCSFASAQQPPGGPPPAVGYAEVESRSVSPTLDFLGRIEAIEKVEIRARVPGFLLEQKVGDGQEVKTGDLLFLLEPDTYIAELEQRRADLGSAEAAAKNSKAQLARTEYLAKRDFASRALLDQRRAETAQGDALVNQSRAALKQAEINLGYTRITSPIVGRIGQRVFSRGAFVGPDSGPLMTIVSQDPMYVVFPVSERELLMIRRRAAARKQKKLEIEVRLLLSDGSRYAHPGKVDFTDVTVAEGTDTVDVRAVVPNPERLLTDRSFVRVQAEYTDPQMALLIPQRAVLNDQRGPYVFVLGAENKAEQRRVTLGQSYGGDVVVSEGLRAKERIIADGVQKVRPGIPVDAAPSKPDDS